LDADRIGVVASILCAIHCAATPVLLLFAPAFGEIWAHPASHWIVALLVVPLAMAMAIRGFRLHRQRWIVATGLLGVVLIIAGAAIPYWSKAEEAASATNEPAACSDSCCPSLVSTGEESVELHVPAASIVTTLGGIALICTHLGNLCACRKRKTSDGCNSPFC